MKTTVLLLVLCLAVAAVVDARFHVPVRKRAPKPLSEQHASLVAAGYPVPLQGNIATYGEYFVGFTIGTPGQFFEAQVDTGSSDLLISSIGCVGCGSGRKFNPKTSKTASKVSCTQFNCASCNSGQCGFNDAYGDGSGVSGNVWTDVLSFPGSTLPNTTIQFGGTEKSSPNFEPTGVDGIFGLSYGVLSSWHGTPPFERMVNQHHIPNVYSMCLTSNGGSLTLGATAPSSVSWTPITKKVWFVITVDDFAVNGVPLGFRASDYADAIVDSGTTLMLLPNAPYAALVNAVKAMCSSLNLPGVCGVQPGSSIFDGYCYPMTPSQIKQFPVITAKIPGVSGGIHVNPSAYLIPNQGTYCWGIAGGGAGVGTILGDVAVQGLNVIYDIGNSRIGFAPGSTCGQ